MKWVRAIDGETTTYGIVESDDVAFVSGSPFGRWERTGETRKLASVRLTYPVTPGSFYCQGRNYATHNNVLYDDFGAKYPASKMPDPSQRSNNALIADGETIVIPADAGPNVHPEGELVVVIGQRCKNVSEADALSKVLGYTVGNDIGQRDWLKSDNMIWRAKNSDTFKPMGPWIETEVDLDALVTRVRINGELEMEHRTNTMIFGIAQVIATMTRYVTLHPGDVIWMGSEGSVRQISHGDVVEIEIEGIGKITNPVIRAS